MIDEFDDVADLDARRARPTTCVKNKLATTEIWDALVMNIERTSHDSDDSTMCHYESVAPGRKCGDSTHPANDSRHDIFVTFEAFGFAPCFEPSGIVAGNLVVGETLPLTAVRFPEVLVGEVNLGAKVGRDDLGGVTCALQIARGNHIEGSQFLGGVKGLRTTEIGQRWIGLTLPFTQCIPFAFAMTNHEKAGGKRCGHEV